MVVIFDVVICVDCVVDIYGIDMWWCGYVFINCIYCGLWFIILKGVFYDWKMILMVVFWMCEDCVWEYEDLVDCCFYVQLVVCLNCGLKVWGEVDGVFVEDDLIYWVVQSLFRGDILVIKGLGGFYLVCDVMNLEVVVILCCWKN